MGILDTFFIAFEADTSKLTKGTDEASKKADGLTDKLKLADKAGDKLGSSFGNLLATAGGAMAAVFSVGAMMHGITEATDYADRLGEVSGALGVNIEELDAWGRAAIFSGGTAEGFQASLSALSADFAMIATKGTSRTLPFFKELGINLKDAHGNMKDVMSVLPDLADKFEGMSKQESIGMGRKLGLDEGTIMLLQRGRRSVEDLVQKQKELGVTTQAQADLAGEFNDSLDTMSMAFRSLFMSVGTSVLPAFKWVVDGFTSMVGFFRKHSDFITGLFIALGTAVLVFLVPPLITAGIAALTAMAPFLLIGAVVAIAAGAFALLYDDIMNFLSGNDSMIGSISAKWPIVGEVVRGLVDTFAYFKDFVIAVFALFVDLINDPMNAFNNFANSIMGGIDKVRGHFPFVFSLLDALASGFTGMASIVVGIWNTIVDAIMEGVNTAKDAINAVSGFFGGGQMEVAHKMAGSARSTPLNSTNSAAISNSKNIAQSQSVNVGKVEVHTKATDAEGIARSVGGHLHGELKRATAAHDDGVKA